MLARLNQKDEEESNISVEAGIDHSCEIVLVKGEGLDLKFTRRSQPLENINTSSNKSRGECSAKKAKK